MRITKFTHACVRVTDGDRVLVIDPGIWSEPEALLGADAVLVTHEHVDHVDELRLLGLGVPVYVPAGAALGRVEAVRVEPGQRFEAAGFGVRAVGGRHALIYGGQPDAANLGYLVEERLYHPGDALHVPDQPVETLFVPVHGSWMKTDEAIDFARSVAPARSFPIHDAMLNERGLGSVNAWFSQETEGFRYLAPGETAD